MSYEKVRDVLVDVLDLDEDEIELDSHLMDDLAAESIDFVDIAFNLEKKFKMKINPGDIFPAFLQEVTIFNDDGTLTAEVADRFEKDYPHITCDQLEAFCEEKNGELFFTVETIVNFVTEKIALKVDG
ncbi:MAG: phosphopantetheine-binding protein [Desulfobacter sp.]